MPKSFLKFVLRPLWGSIRRRDEHVASVQKASTQAETAAVDGALPAEVSYADQIQRELARFNEVTNVHDLPGIQGYWSNRYLLPLLKECGFEGVDEFYAKYLLRAAQRVGSPARFISIGAGNCDTEVRVAVLLRKMGLEGFELECLELNPTMLERGRESAVANGVGGLLTFTQADFNYWQPRGRYAGVMANHSLHHVTNLEHLFDSIKTSLDARGYFVTGDMIGRNGHMRWPEALEHVERIWEELPVERRYNHQLRRYEEQFVNWDCSGEGFEGIRAQDILPLLLERFEFPVFIGFANVVAPFIDRCFGHNLDASCEADRALIDRAHSIDEEGFRSGTLKPTQMFAVMSTEKSEAHVYARGLSPQQSVRVPT